ncbi:hypothetical protein UFOVP244_155 [uncultured Caudovirales phage]|uniref:Uncharacterized protein n=1 Tax=uncultured Caudovirales phage TaxID=2100421 RepID=A0A6J7WXG3_9CAUD|nr:hypothetical protein UFOVP244_155 [uncultured Caudovirales phage]
MEKPSISVTQHLSFIITLVCVVGILALAFYRNLDLSSLLPTILGLYLGARTIDKTNVAWAASKDPKADTAKVIKDNFDK